MHELKKLLTNLTGENTKQDVIIICDPGIDDALMLLQLLNNAKYNIKGIIPVSGNASAETCLFNTLALCEAVGYTGVDVYPIQCSAPINPFVYQSDGLNGITLPEPKKLKSKVKDGLLFLCDTIREQKVIIISTADLTLLRTALVKLDEIEPASLKNILVISMMGGVINRVQEANFPNVPVRSFEANFGNNYTATTLAFKIIQKHQIPILLSPLDMTQTVLLSQAEIKSLKRSKHIKANYAYTFLNTIPEHYLKRYGRGPDNHYRQPIHDVHASACLLHPELYCYEQIAFETDKGLVLMPDSDNLDHGFIYTLFLPYTRRQSFINTLFNDYEKV